MTHSFRVHFFHLIWSTKGRQKWITKDVQARLYAYLGEDIIETFFETANGSDSSSFQEGCNVDDWAILI